MTPGRSFQLMQARNVLTSCSRCVSTRLRAWSLVAVGLGCLGHAGAMADELRRVDYAPDAPDATEVIYKHTPEGDLRAWVLAPVTPVENASSPRRPAIVFFFGGGWRSGSPRQFLTQARYLRDRGMVAVLADYRVASRHQVKAVACAEDAKSAVRWLRTHAAELGIDADRICAAGGSAGGHIACCTAAIDGFDHPGENPHVSSRPDALALFNPAVMLAAIENPDSSTGFNQERMRELHERMGVDPKLLSPVHHISPGMPPTLIVHGEADTTVPFDTVQVFRDRMLAAGNRCELVGYPGAPHGFFNWKDAATQIGSDRLSSDNSGHWYRRTLLRLDEFLTSLEWIAPLPATPAVHSEHVRVRGSLKNSLHRFRNDKRGHVAFVGGSITEMNGYRPIVEQRLRELFPDTEFTFTAAGIASTCSTTGAFRLHRDVLQHGPVDLLLVEFAVNDDQDAQYSAEDCLRGMEGILVQARRHNPAADIVMVHFVNPEMLDQIQRGIEPVSSGQHERLARHYQIPSVYLSRELADRIQAGSMTWEDYGGTHPGPAGNALAAGLVTDLLQSGWSMASFSHAEPVPHVMPADVLCAGAWLNPEILPDSALQPQSGWQFDVPDWTNLPGSKRDRFVHQKLWYAAEPGATVVLKFAGNAVGAWVLAGPDAGQLEIRIDDGAWHTVELYHRFSRGLHYPRTVMLAKDLPAGRHTAEVRVGADHHPDSSGNAARVLSFLVNH